VLALVFLFVIGNFFTQVARDCDPSLPQAELEQCIEDQLTN
jgi:hypothetical protein